VADKQLYPLLPLPPAEYDVDYLDRLVSVLQIYLRQNMEPGYVRASTMALTKLPTNGGGLRVGDVFDDEGTLRIVRSIDAFSGTTLGTGAVGTATVLIS
jgi:hypothetical protein